jgi:predicted dehydrogenase
MSVSRRKFIRISVAATLAAGVASRVIGAENRLQLGLIGSGGRGRSLLLEAVKQGNDCVALCDVAPFRMEAATAAIQKAGAKEKPVQYADHRKLLEHKGLDAVIIATPDHWHHDILLDAMASNKDAYIEKPLSHTIEQGRSMVVAVRRTKCIVQVGNQRHSGAHWKRCKDVIQSKDFGDLVWVKVWDCRNWVKRDPFAPPADFTMEKAAMIDWKRFLGSAPARAFDANRYFAWRWYWDYAGGLLTDIGAHQLDIVQWLGGQENGPRSVVANGGVYHFKHWETPDVIHGVWDYGKFAATFAVEFVNGYDGVGATFYGTKKTLWADAQKEIRVYDTIDQPRPDQKPLESWKVENETPAHIANWLECIRSRKQPNSTIELGHRVITAAHLANMSYRTGQKIHWDATAEKVIPSSRPRAG